MRYADPHPKFNSPSPILGQKLTALLGSDWDSKKQYHIDLWTGSNTAGGGQDQIDCEDNLPGGSQTIILDPPSGLPVDCKYPR